MHVSYVSHIIHASQASGILLSRVQFNSVVYEPLEILLASFFSQNPDAPHPRPSPKCRDAHRLRDGDRTPLQEKRVNDREREGEVIQAVSLRARERPY